MRGIIGYPNRAGGIINDNDLPAINRDQAIMLINDMWLTIHIDFMQRIFFSGNYRLHIMSELPVQVVLLNACCEYGSKDQCGADNTHLFRTKKSVLAGLVAFAPAIGRSLALSTYK